MPKRAISKSYFFVEKGGPSQGQRCSKITCSCEIEKRGSHFVIRENTYCLDCGTDILIGEIAEMADAMDGYRLYWRDR